MRAKTIIPAAFMGLGAYTAYYIYASTQNLSQKADQIAERITYFEENKNVRPPSEEPEKPRAKNNKKNQQQASLKPADSPKKSVQAEEEKPELQTTDRVSPEKYRAAFKPLLEKKYSEADLKAFTKAYEQLRKRRITKAKKTAKAISDPLMHRCLNWYRVKSSPHDYTYTELRKFWESHSDWPALDGIRAAAESKLISARKDTIREYLDEHEPISSAGLLAKAALLLSENQKDEATKLVRHVWREGSLSKSVDKIIMKRHKKMLTKDDHHFRAQRYLYKGRSKYVSSALRVASKLDKPTRKLLDVQIASLRRTKQVVKKILALSEKEKLEPNIIYTRAKRFRKKKKYEDAWKLMIQAPNDPEQLVVPKKWWKIKRGLILEAMNKKLYKTAYELAKNHGQNTANELNDAEFLAGWLSLRYLNKPKEAYEHFKAHNKHADGPRSRSRSLYWMGRSAAALKKTEEAKKHFLKASAYFNTFYGQLSKQSLDPKARSITIAKTEQPTGADIHRFVKRDAVKVAILADRAGQDFLAARFLGALRYKVKTAGEMILLAEMAKQLGHTQQAVRIGKTAMFKGIRATEYAYPVHAMPKIKPLRGMPEPAFAFAIARQESEFNTKIKSHVGARGLMQVMPATAKLLARQYKIKYSKKKLTEDPVYNVRLGTAYISGRLEEFSGSYIKTIAGYNAGPGRVRQWSKKFGDPNNSNIDPIDWIERIPFHETRNYVKKVLANMQVYRALLGNGENALRLREDLYRGRRDSHKASRPVVASK